MLVQDVVAWPLREEIRVKVRGSCDFLKLINLKSGKRIKLNGREKVKSNFVNGFYLLQALKGTTRMQIVL